MDISMHKGQNGKLGVMGGSKEYTGAPYYVGAASLRSGADIVHVFCTESASVPIKSYSPELIVHPILEDAKESIKWLDACTSISIGSGLGRDPKLGKTLAEIVEAISSKDNDLPLVCDADILWYMCSSDDQDIKSQLQKSITKMQSRAILTPNTVEFERMYKGLQLGEDYDKDQQNQIEYEFYQNHMEQCGTLDNDHQMVQPIVKLASALNNVIVLKKGLIDLVTDGNHSYYIATKSSLKRCGGQGDILSGILGSFVNYSDNLKFDYQDLTQRRLLTVVAGSALNRMTSKYAYDEKTISLTAPDILDHIDHLFKLVLLGDSCVGKSCLLVRFADDEFYENYISTIGVDFWDTAGQERYRTITNAYYRGADGIILVFDMFKMQTFNNLHSWLKEVEKHAKNDVNIIIIGNKSDQAEIETPEVQESDMQKFTQDTGIPIFTASAKTGKNVENSFLNITSQLIQKAQSNVKESLYGSTQSGEQPKKMKENQPARLNRDRKQQISERIGSIQNQCCAK